MIPQDRKVWAAGYEAGLQGLPCQGPWELDRLSFFSGYCEGCAERDRLREIVASVRPDLDFEFNVEPGLKGKVASGIVGTSLDKSDEIDALAKLPETEQRRLTRVAKAGKKVSAKTRIRQLQLRGRFSPRATGR